MSLRSRLLQTYHNYTSDHYEVTFVPKSPSQMQLIISEDTLQSMELDYNAATNKTLIRIRTINSSDYHDRKSDSLGKSGEWLWLGNSNHSLGCSLFKLNNSNQLALVRFKNDELHELVQWSIPATLNPAYPIYITQDCSFVSAGFVNWRVDELTVSGSSTPTYSVVEVNPPEMEALSGPRLATPKGANGDSLYTYAEGRVHKFSLSHNQNITNLTLPHVNPYEYTIASTSFEMKTFHNRILLTSVKNTYSSFYSRTITTVNIYLIVDTGSVLKMVDLWKFTENSGQGGLRNVFSSPQLTRIFYQFRNVNNQT